MGREKIFAKDGLKPGDVAVCELRIGTMYVTRPKDPNADAVGEDVLLWGDGDNKKYVSSVTDRSSFLDFMMALAETHDCGVQATHQTEERVACVLVARNR